MKKHLYSLAAIALFLCLCFYSKANFNQGRQPVANSAKIMRACFNDGHYTWHIIFTQTNNPGIYACVGTASVGEMK